MKLYLWINWYQSKKPIPQKSVFSSVVPRQKLSRDFERKLYEEKISFSFVTPCIDFLLILKIIIVYK